MRLEAVTMRLVKACYIRHFLEKAGFWEIACLRRSAWRPLRLNRREPLGRNGQLRVQAGRQLLAASWHAYFCLIKLLLLRLPVACRQARAQEPRRIGACPRGVGHACVAALHPGKGRQQAAAEQGLVLTRRLLLLLHLLGHLEQVEVEQTEATKCLRGLAAVCCWKERVEHTCKPHTHQ